MWIFAFILPVLSWAMPTLHFIKPESSFTQITSLDACTTYIQGPDMVRCNPGLFPLQKDTGLRMGLSTITDGESVEVGQKLLFDPIKKPFLEELFQKRSYNSWDLNTLIELRATTFHLGYDPLSVNADVFVFNPSSPEVAMSLIKSNRLHAATGIKLQDTESVLLTLGGKIYYYRSEYFQDSFFLSDLSSNEVTDLIDLKKRSGVAGDLGAFFMVKDSWFPRISLLVKNIGTKFRNEEEDIKAENQLRPLLVYETYSRLSLGQQFRGDWGSLSGELSFPFRNYFSEYYTEYPSLSLGYALTRFNTQIALSKYQQVFGMNFGSKIATVGIFYGWARPLGDFSNQTEGVGGVRVEVSL